MNQNEALRAGDAKGSRQGKDQEISHTESPDKTQAPTLDCPDYEAIKAAAVTLKRPAKTLYALSDATDPFYLTPGRRAAAEWFAEVWSVLNPPDGVHLRRLHYSLVSLPEDRRPAKLTGQAYENTEADWGMLCTASVAARELGLVDIERFVDRRAGDPTLIADEDDEDEEASIDLHHVEALRPFHESIAIDYIRRTYASPTLPAFEVIAPDLAEPYAVELWIEKSTMNDVLAPLAERHQVTLITGTGELSLTHAHWLVKRALAHGKKTRILYISDFDPAGARMPVSIARKVEYLIRRSGHVLDIRIEPLLLTREQVEHYHLPRIPIKDSDPGRRFFEERHGPGATELDALEALFPGELERLVEEAIERYREPTAEARDENRQIAAALAANLDNQRRTVIARFGERLDVLRREFDAMQRTIAPHQDALVAIAQEAEERGAQHVAAINDAVGGLYEGASALWTEIAEAIDEEAAPDPAAIDWGIPYDADEGNDPLFDSARSYLDQINAYKNYQGMPTSRRKRGNGGAR